MPIRYISPLLLVAALTAAIVIYDEADNSGQREDTAGNVGVPSNSRQTEKLAVHREAARSRPAKVKVSLYGGEEFNVVLRPRPWRTLENPESLADVYDELVNRAAAGEIVAAISLSKLLRRCDEQPYTTAAQLEDAMAQLRSEGSVPFRVQGVVIDQPADPSLENSIAQTFEFCSGVSAEQRAQHQDWLRLAADMGDPLAQVTLAREYPNGSQEAKEYLLRAWQAGSIDAAGWLARMYRYEHDGHKKDLVKSYAYLSVYSKLVKADFAIRDMMNDPAALEWMAADESSLLRGESELDAEELAMANKMANKILSSNTACCFIRPH